MLTIFGLFVLTMGMVFNSRLFHLLQCSIGDRDLYEEPFFGRLRLNDQARVVVLYDLEVSRIRGHGSLTLTSRGRALGIDDFGHFGTGAEDGIGYQTGNEGAEGGQSGPTGGRMVTSMTRTRIERCVDLNLIVLGTMVKESFDTAHTR